MQPLRMLEHANGSTYARVTAHVPTIMCDNCTNTLTEVLGKVEGIDTISTAYDKHKPDSPKTMQFRMNISNAKGNVHFDNRGNAIVQTWKLDGLDKVRTAIDDAGQELTHFELDDLEKQPRQGSQEQTLTGKDASCTDSTGQACNLPQKTNGKKAPVPFAEVLMKHPAMKTLQASTMILMTVRCQQEPCNCWN